MLRDLTTHPLPLLRSRVGLALATALLAAGCDASGTEPCTTSSDCPGTDICVEGRCQPPRDAASSDGGTTDADAAPPPHCDCAPGEVCRSDRCVPDCADPMAVDCGAGQTCDILTARCVPEGSDGILTGDGAACGPEGPRCLPGTACSVDKRRCVPQPPCLSMRCSEDGSTCWGTTCQTERPEPWCRPAPLDRLNQADFLLTGRHPSEGIDDLEFDEVCNAYASTMISGPDFVRQLAPDGTLTTWQSISNLNMGEVAVLRPLGGEFGSGDGPGEVAATYICCASCGCRAGDPQGVVRLVRDDPMTPLPMVVTATLTQGDGPFGIYWMDTGPAGLLWGPDRNLYVGNVEGNGDLVHVDLASGTHRTLVTFEERIFASENYDQESILVALEGGRVERVAIADGAHETWLDLGPDVDVASLVRDPFRGDVYAVVREADGTFRLRRWSGDGEELSLPDGAGVTAAARIAYAPDGKLYVAYLQDERGTIPHIEAFDLPSRY